MAEAMSNLVDQSSVCDTRSQVSNTMAVVCLEVNRNSLDRHESDGPVDRLECGVCHARDTLCELQLGI